MLYACTYANTDSHAPSFNANSDSTSANADPASPTARKIPTRGYARLFEDHILQADQGCDFDFLQRNPDARNLP